MTREQAKAVYDILKAEAGAPEAYWSDFATRMMEGSREFRFIGNLGFDGKFYASADRWWVGGTPTPERSLIIERVNDRLTRLKADLVP